MKNIRRCDSGLFEADFKESDIDNILKYWKGNFDDTIKDSAFVGIKWNDEWVTALKSHESEDVQQRIFAEGVITGYAFQS